MEARSRFGFQLLAVPAIVWLVVAFAVPLVVLLASSVVDRSGALGLSNFRMLLTDRFYLNTILNTFSFAGFVSVACIVLAYPFALAMAAMRPAYQSILMMMTLIPLTASVIVKAFGWTVILSSNGIANNLLRALHITEEPVRFLYALPGLFIGGVNLFLPFAVLPIFAAARMISPEIHAAARVLGAGTFTRFVRITLPLTAPGLLAALAIVFSSAASAYVIPTFLSGEARRTMPMLIYYNYMVAYNEPMGAAMAVLLLVIIAATLALSAYLTRRRRMAGTER